MLTRITQELASRKAVQQTLCPIQGDLSTPAEFVFFPRLPRELQRLVIKHALPALRIIEITSVWWLSSHTTTPTTITWARQHTKDSTLLHVSKEFRQETLQFLKPIAGNARGCWKIYVNPRRDLFVIGNVHDWVLTSTQEVPVILEGLVSQLGQISYLALEERQAGFLPRWDARLEIFWGRVSRGIALQNCGLKELLVAPVPVRFSSNRQLVATQASETLGGGNNRNPTYYHRQRRAIAGFEEDHSMLTLEGVSESMGEELVSYCCGNRSNEQSSEDAAVPRIVFGHWVPGALDDQWYEKSLPMRRILFQVACRRFQCRVNWVPRGRFQLISKLIICACICASILFIFDAIKRNLEHKQQASVDTSREVAITGRRPDIYFEEGEPRNIPVPRLMKVRKTSRPKRRLQGRKAT